MGGLDAGGVHEWPVDQVDDLVGVQALTYAATWRRNEQRREQQRLE